MAEIYFEIIRLFFLVGAVMGVVVGSLLFLKPEVLSRFNQASNNWYTPRKQTKNLEIMRDTDPLFYRNHQLTGWVMLAASVVALYLIFSRYPSNPFDTITSLTAQWRFTFNVINESVKWFFIVFIILGLPVWVLLIFNPEQLGSISKFFNRWISTRNMLRPLEEMNTNFDDMVLRHPRAFGAFFVAGSLFVFIFFFKS